MAELQEFEVYSLSHALENTAAAPKDKHIRLEYFTLFIREITLWATVKKNNNELL